MTGIDEIPTAPSTPTAVPQLYSPNSHYGDDTSDEPFDMISSIESLAAWSRPGTPSLLHSVNAPSSATGELVPAGPHRHPLASVASSSHDFVMPSLPSPPSPASTDVSGYLVSSIASGQGGAPVQYPLLGDLCLALAGNMPAAADLLAQLAQQIPGESRMETELGIEKCTCSTSSGERDNVVIYDTSYGHNGGTSLTKWLDAQLTQSKPVHAVLYVLGNGSRATEEDLRVMKQIQKLAVLVVVAESPCDLVNLARHGIFGFRQEIWDPHNVSLIAKALLEHGEHIRALSSSLQSQWYESQLVMTTLEPAGALCQRVNLRSKALESIDNIDPLGLSNWATLSKLAVMLISGAIASSLTAFGVTCVWTRLAVVPVTPAPRRHALSDLEHWPQWLV